jgi:anti-anti-sigma factor
MEHAAHGDRQIPTAGRAGPGGDPPDTLTCASRRLSAALCLSFTGGVNLATISWFRTQLQAAAQSTDHLILDFSTLTYIDSSGIHALLDAFQLFTLARRRMTIAAVPPRIRRALAAFGVDEIISVFSTVEAALAGGGSSSTNAAANLHGDTNSQGTR